MCWVKHSCATMMCLSQWKMRITVTSSNCEKCWSEWTWRTCESRLTRVITSSTAAANWRRWALRTQTLTASLSGSRLETALTQLDFYRLAPHLLLFVSSQLSLSFIAGTFLPQFVSASGVLHIAWFSVMFLLFILIPFLLFPLPVFRRRMKRRGTSSWVSCRRKKKKWGKCSSKEWKRRRPSSKKQRKRYHH